MTTPRFPVTYCSQCGGAFGPGDHGYSHCSGHTAGMSALEVPAPYVVIAADGEVHGNCETQDGAERCVAEWNERGIEGAPFRWELRA